MPYFIVNLNLNQVVAGNNLSSSFLYVKPNRGGVCISRRSPFPVKSNPPLPQTFPCDSAVMEGVSSNESPEILELATLLEKIAENPYEYDNHVTYINLLRKIGDAEDLRQAREIFHSLYPFSEGTTAAQPSISLLLD